MMWHPRQHQSTPINDSQRCQTTGQRHRSTAPVYGGDRRSMVAVKDGHRSTPVTLLDHLLTSAVYGGDQRSMVAVNDGRRWRTIVDHHRTIGQPPVNGG
nr:hypothetical protein [Tanacetum cinerariifolium]